MYRPKILVVGSFVKDLIVSTHKFPDKGETVLGYGFQMATGGKGANQAIQAARLGAQVTMVGKVGSDDFGKDLVNACLESGIDCSKVMVDLRQPSSVGNVQLLVDENGTTQNRIIVVPGANMSITPAEIQFLRTEIEQYDMVLLQLEIPMEINRMVVEYASQAGVPVMLNTAPSDAVSPEILSHLTYISLNECEARDMTGIPIRVSGRTADQGSVREAVEKLLDKGVKNVLITLGAAGAAFGNRNEFFLIPALDKVTSVDPTAAGAFVTSRKDAMLAKPIMMGIIFTMYFSGGLIPLYLLVNNLGLYNTRAAIILVGLVNTWNLIVMRTSYLAIPDSLEESAKIDGASPMRIFTKIYLPLSKPMLATMTLFYGVGNWNSWFNHMIFLRDRSKYPLQLIMREILIANDMSSMTNMNTVGTYTNDMYQVLVKYAVVVIATLPILCIYPFLQRYFIKGVMVGAIKG